MTDSQIDNKAFEGSSAVPEAIIVPRTRTRVFGFIVDSAISTLVSVPILAALYLNGYLSISLTEKLVSATFPIPYLIAQTLLAIGSIAYFQIYRVHKFGATIGQQRFRIETVTIGSAERPSLEQASLRWAGSILGYVLPMANEIFALFNPERRTIGDRFADTRVIDRLGRRKTPARSRYVLGVIFLIIFSASTAIKLIKNPSSLFENFHWDTSSNALVYSISPASSGRAQ